MNFTGASSENKWLGGLTVYNDCLWSVQPLAAERRFLQVCGHLSLNSFPEPDCIKQPFSGLDLLALYSTAVSSVKTDMLLRPREPSQSRQSF